MGLVTTLIAAATVLGCLYAMSVALETSNRLAVEAREARRAIERARRLHGGS